MHARTLLDSLWPITGWRLWQYRALQAGLLLCGLFLMVTVMSVPLELEEQFIFGVLCFAYLAFYAVAARRALHRQGIDLDKLAASGGGH